MSLRIRHLIREAEVPPRNRQEMLDMVPDLEFGPGRTEQGHKDACDINKILKKHQTKSSLSHALKYPELVYGEFDGEFDLLTAQARLKKAGDIFSEAPSEVRREFGNDPIAFVQFMNRPDNQGRYEEVLKAISAPGNYFPNPIARGGQGAGAATAPAEPVQPTPVEEPTPAPDNPGDAP